MKYLLLSDIHGSLPRLRTVLDIYRKERCDMLLLLGDIMNYGPRNSLPEGLDARGVAEELNKMRDEIVAVRAIATPRSTRCCSCFPSWPLTPWWWTRDGNPPDPWPRV